jgi:GNAT superfamily N-acetyltransferase
MAVECKILQEPLSVLKEYGQIPIEFVIRSVFDVRVNDQGLGGFSLVERILEKPYTKDYDALKGEGPIRWATRWNISNWGLITAVIADQRVGGCVLAHNTEGVDMLQGRRDIAVLWDIRVHPDHRGCGIGAKLFEAATEWAKKRECRILKVETQNINVPACRFYAGQGCVLGSMDRFAYAELPDEVQLMWYKTL